MVFIVSSNDHALNKGMTDYRCVRSNYWEEKFNVVEIWKQSYLLLSKA